MSKLSRKEFKKLLIEWKNNFVNEEIIQPIAYSKDFAGQISDVDIEDLKSQNYPAYLMILPTVKSAVVNKIYNYEDKSKNTYEKSESNYNLIRDKIKNLFNRNFTSEDLGLNNEEELEDYHGGLYKDGQMPRIPDNFPANEEMIDSLEKAFKKAKPYMTDIKDGPFIINFTSVYSVEAAQESGGLFSISKMKPHVSKSFVAWLLKHDFHHTLEFYIFDSKNQAEEFQRKCIGVRFFSMPGLRESRSSEDNYASVTGFLFGKTKEDKESLLIDRFHNVIKVKSKFNSTYIPNYDVKEFVDELSFYNLSNIDLNDIVNGLFIEDSEGDILYDNKLYRERFEDDPLFINTRQKLIDNVIEITDEFERKIREKFLGDLKDKIIITYYAR